MPAVTPGPQAQFVRDVVTAIGVDQNGAPVSPTTLFAVGTPVYVVCVVRGVTPGQAHRLSIRWYLQGQQPQMPGASTYATVTQDGPVSFDVIYTATGDGMARLYWDEPVADNSDRPNDQYLAQAVAFTVQ